MSDWKEYKLGDVIEIKYGKDHKHLADGNFPLYGSGGIMRYVEKSIYNEETILIPRKGTLTNLFYLSKPFWAVDTIFWSKINTELCHGKYLYYLLKTHDLESLNVGSAVPSLTTEVLNEHNILLPPLPQQQAMAGILSSLDDKIDLLHRQNKTLEALAETLFRQWFIEETDESWEETKLGRLVTTVIDNRGKTPPTIEYKTEYPLIEVNAINTDNCLINYSVIRKYLLKETFESWFRKHLEQNDIIISTVGTIGILSIYEGGTSAIAQNLIGLRFEKQLVYFIYLYLKSNIPTLISLDIEGVQPSIKVPHLLNLPLRLPPFELLVSFNKIIADNFQKIKSNSKQIQSLTQLRDNLLPKLMSGEVTVGE